MVYLIMTVSEPGTPLLPGGPEPMPNDATAAIDRSRGATRDELFITGLFSYFQDRSRYTSATLLFSNGDVDIYYS